MLCYAGRIARANLIDTPVNVAVVRGSPVTLNCTTNRTTIDVRWNVVLSHTKEEKRISKNQKIFPNFTSVYSIDADELSGKFNLVINATEQLRVGTYVCLEFDSREKKFSSQLIELGSYIIS